MLTNVVWCGYATWLSRCIPRKEGGIQVLADQALSSQNSRILIENSLAGEAHHINSAKISSVNSLQLKNTLLWFELNVFV